MTRVSKNKIVNEINHEPIKKNTYYYILKYFYSWYLLPMVLLHEGTHILMGLLCGFKINKVKIYNMKGNLPLWNGLVKFNYRKFDWKWYVTLYAPLLLLIPILLMWLNPIFLFIGLYIISTIFYFRGKFYWLTLPSAGDIDYKRKIEYHTYIVNHVGEKRFNHYFKKGKLNKLIGIKRLLNEQDFFIEKSNKNKNYQYNLINRLSTKIKRKEK